MDNVEIIRIKVGAIHTKFAEDYMFKKDEYTKVGDNYISNPINVDNIEYYDEAINNIDTTIYFGNLHYQLEVGYLYYDPFDKVYVLPIKDNIYKKSISCAGPVLDKEIVDKLDKEKYIIDFD